MSFEELSHDELLDLLLDDEGIGFAAGVPMLHREADDDAVLSFAQQQLWTAAHIAPSPSLYNVPSAMRLRGPLDAGALEEALDTIVSRHESLRTAFVLDGEEPVQAVHPFVDDEILRIVDAGSDEAMLDVYREEAMRPFDLTSGRMLRALLIRRAADDHLLVAVMHHIVSDAWSLSIFWNELAALYSASTLPELPLQYADYALWQRGRLAGDALAASEEYWASKLAALPALLALPFDRPRPATATHAGATVTVDLPPAAYATLCELARQESATPFMALLAAFAVLLHGASGADDLVVGSPISGRHQEEIEPLIGYFVNMLPLRADLSGAPAFRELLRRVRRTCIDAFAHQDVPFERLVEVVAPRRTAAHPIFQAVFAARHNEAAPRFEGLVAEAVPFDGSTSKFDLMLEVVDSEARMTYATELFDAATIEGLLASFAKLLAQIAANPDERVDRLAASAGLQTAAPVHQTEHRPADVAHHAPRNETEQQIATIFAELLGVEGVGVHHNFFDLGGHSLLATRAVSRARKAFGVELPLRALFDSPTVASMATAIHAIREAERHTMTPRTSTSSRESVLVRGGCIEAEASFEQQRLWFVTQLLPESPMYNVPAALRLQGVVDEKTLAGALTEIVRRHEALRTTFRDDGGRTLQIVNATRAVVLPVEDFRNLELESKSAAVTAALRNEAERLFDLRHDLLLRARLIRLADDDSILLLTLHHIASDGWSMNVLFDELSALVDGQLLPEPAFQYTDFAAWQRASVKGGRTEASLAYWRERLAGIEVLELPSDRLRPATMSFRGGRESFRLDAALSRDLRVLASEEGVTPFMVLLAAYAMLLHRYTGRTDLAIGSPVAGRDRVEVEDLIGFFVNSVILRVRPEGTTSFRELLAEVRQTCLDAWAHQDVPFERLVEVLQPQRDLRHNPLFQTIFALRQEGATEMRIGPLPATVEEVEVTTAKFDLGMEIEERKGTLFAHLSYSSDLFDAATVRRMLGHYATLLRGALSDRDTAIGHLDLLTADEHDTILGRFNDTAAEYERDASLSELFEQQAARTPDAVAAITADETGRITYLELDRRANVLAEELRRRGAGPEVAVAVLMERSIDMLVALVAIAKTGAPYVPLEPAFPAERLRLIKSNADVRLVIGPELSIEGEAGGEWIGGAVRGDNLAYITYTSGSTGVPKGVAVPNRAVARLVRNNDFATVGPNDVVLQYAPLAFDASTFEVWAALLGGAALVVMPPQASLEELGAAIAKHGVTTLWLTAGLFHLMVEQRLADFAGVRQLLAGGDVLSPWHVERVLHAHPSIRVINGYGPTENTTFTCCHGMSADDAATAASGVPIGRPIRNTRVFILDRTFQPLPIGVAGELFAAGDGLARGYVTDAALTAERFIPNPFANGERLYRTGDLARWRADGTIEFLGRADHQVKIRGYRIELGEIESVLRGLAGVRNAAVVTRGENGEKRLVAYIAGRGEAPELRSALRQFLPDYMIPSTFVFLDTLPLTGNGKVDRKGLPLPSSIVEKREPRLGAAQATSDTERIVAEAWEELLGNVGAGVHDNFFDVGGHSLLLLQLRTRLVERFGKDIPLMEMFRKPTIRAMGDFLDARTAPMAADGVVHDHNQRAQMRRMSIHKRKQHIEERQNRS